MAGSYNGVSVHVQRKKDWLAGREVRRPGESRIVPFIEGDGTGRDIGKRRCACSMRAVEKAYNGKAPCRMVMKFSPAEKAKAKFDNWLPDDTVDAIRRVSRRHQRSADHARGGGIRSLNVALRRSSTSIAACVR